MGHFFKFSTRDPERLETVIAPMVGSLNVRPVKTSKFHAKVCARQSSRLAVYSIQADTMKIFIAPPHNYIALRLPLGRPFTENNQGAHFQHDIHILRPDRELSLEASEGVRVLAANLFLAPLREYALKLTAAEEPLHPTIGNRIAISSPSGLLLSRRLAMLWCELHRTESSPDSSISIMEKEDALIAGLIMASGTRGDNNRHSERVENRAALARAEEYLNASLTAPVSQADLAAAAGVSIRTLSRGFAKRHGFGPMAFLKTRRLDTVYRDLLGADADSTTVTEVATHYGFSNLGKFAVEYRQTFGESPSVTLKY